MTYVKRWRGWKISCDVGEETGMLENEQRSNCAVGEATEGLQNEL